MDLNALIKRTEKNADYIELRYHRRYSTSVKIAVGELEEASTNNYSGIGIRALVKGAWGFCSTSDTTSSKILASIKNAIKSAKYASQNRLKKVEMLAGKKFAKGRYAVDVAGRLEDIAIEDKIKLVQELEGSVRNYSQSLKSAVCQYVELIDCKRIISSDGCDFEIYDSKPGVKVVAVASENTKKMRAFESACVTGGWQDLMRKKDIYNIPNIAAERAEKLLSARTVKGGRSTVVLDPTLVGLLAHEAVGHTVEADFVLAGSVMQNKIGKKVASEYITLVDAGITRKRIVDNQKGAGTIIVDDEGVFAKETVLIEKGILRGYLHNRETAHIFGTEPTGNARAFEYSDEPIIRMRNTYIEAGDWKYDEIIADTKNGYLLKGAIGGQADANAEFMFSVQEAYKIEKGEIKNLFCGAAITGQAFDVLSTADAVSKELEIDMGYGYCGKFQLAKVDGGGPYVRCKALIGGV
jgi:TldD protein